MSKTNIEWCDETINPIIGCSKVSAGCQNCYAEKMACRLANMALTAGTKTAQYTEITNCSVIEKEIFDMPTAWNGNTALVPSALKRIPGKGKLVFVGSMGDLFHESVDVKWIDMIITYLNENKHHTFMFLTKRPERMLRYFNGWCPVGNLWLGVTCENQRTADERIPLLLQTPAIKRFVSVEPMLGPIDISKHLTCKGCCTRLRKKLSGGYIDCCPEGTNMLDWVICGAETGAGKRFMDWQWAGNLYDQCRNAGVPFFGKKDSKRNPLEVDGEVVREFPNTKGDYRNE